MKSHQKPRLKKYIVRTGGMNSHWFNKEICWAATPDLAVYYYFFNNYKGAVVTKYKKTKKLNNNYYATVRVLFSDVKEWVKRIKISEY